MYWVAVLWMKPNILTPIKVFSSERQAKLWINKKCSISKVLMLMPCTKQYFKQWENDIPDGEILVNEYGYIAGVLRAISVGE